MPPRKSYGIESHVTILKERVWLVCTVGSASLQLYGTKRVVRDLPIGYGRLTFNPGQINVVK